MYVQSSVSEKQEFGSRSKIITLKVIILLFAVVFIGRLMQLQIIKGSDYKMVSDGQAIKKVRVEPFRGHIYDREGNLIVHNEPSFSIAIIPNEFSRRAIPLLASIVEADSTEIINRLAEYRHYNPFLPIKIFRDADPEKVSLVEEYSDYLPGVEIIVESKRLYDFDGNMGHLLGYIREINPTQLERRPYLKPGDLIGQSGIEQSFDNELRGTEGVKFVAVNKFGEKVASFDQGSRDLDAKNGFDLILSIDIRLQELAEELLKDKRGSIVALDPNTGEVMILASKPDFDPRDFSGRVPTEIYNQLSTDPDSPLLHRAIMSQYPPGSTWKMFIALACLAEGIIQPSSTIYSAGSFTYGGRTFADHAGAGNFTIQRSLTTSSNSVYYRLGLQLGLEKFEKWGKLFGFGSKTFIDIPNESSGLLPSKSWLERRLGKGNYEGRMVNYGIGQGEILVTPLQMAVYTASIANKGYIIQPRIVKAIYNNITKITEETNYGFRELPIEKRHFEPIIEGMYGAVNLPGGTAARARVPGIEVCGKTGTAQNPHGKNHAWFVSFAPRENPEIVLVVFIENSGYGGVVAAPIAGKILNSYFYPDAEQLPLDYIYYDPATPLDSIGVEVLLEEIEIDENELEVE
jgi:penicillin-binding protein 2